MNKRAAVIILVAFALLLIAATIKSGWLYMVSSFMFALVVAGFLSCLRSTRNVRVTRECPAEVFEGEPFSVSLRLRNTGRMTRYLITLRDLQFSPGSGREGLITRLRRRRDEYRELVRTGRQTPKAQAGRDGGRPVTGTRIVTVERLVPGSLDDVSYKLSAPRRGDYERARIEVSSGGIFGVTRGRKDLEIESPIIVFPAISWLESFPFDPRATYSPVESYEWARKGIGQDYYGVREYVHGDSLRHVHWKASARHGTLIVREFQQEFRPSAGVLLLLGRPSLGTRDTNSLEDGLRAAASVANYYSIMGSLPQMVLPAPEGGEFEVREPQELRECLELLARYEPPSPDGGRDAGGERVARALEFARWTLAPGSAIAFITNFPPEDVREGLEAFEGMEQLTLVAVLDSSYGGGPGRDGARSLDELSRAARIRGANMYVVSADRGIGRCLSEPFNATGS